MVVALPAESPDLTADGVLLTAWEQGDLPRILELADEEGRRWSRSLAGVRTLDDARRWVAERAGGDRVDWAVRDPATRALIGRVGLHRFQDPPRRAEVGYGVHPAHRGRGVASTAVAAVLAWAYGDLGLRRVELVHDVDNPASCTVAVRAGFALEGVEREALGYPDGPAYLRGIGHPSVARWNPHPVVGSVSLRSVNRVDLWATASYWVLPEARGRGVAPRALRLASTHAFEVLGLHRVQLQHAVGNVASCRVAEKAGFALEGVQRGSCRLAEGFVDEHLHARVAT